MELLKTPSFELAVYIKGSPAAEKVAIVVPGRLDTKDYIHNTSLVDFLSTRGYYALSFDPPGTWESPGSIDLYSTTNYLKAVDELISFFGNKPTLLAGHSRGGTVAMLAGPRNTHISHIVPIFSVYGAPTDPEEENIIDGALLSYRDLPPGTEETEMQKEFRLPLTYFDDGAQYNALPGLQAYTKPKLFFYGTEDDVNTENEIREAFEASADPKMIYGVKSDHDYRYRPQIIAEINTVVGKFLDQYP